MNLDAVFVDLEEDIYDRHGIYALSAVLKEQGLAVSYVASANPNKALATLKELRPRYVLYSTYSSFFSRYADFDARLKREMQVFSVMGGPCITFNPGILQGSTMDAGCMGEGEAALTALITGDAIPAKNIFLRGETPPDSFDPFVDLDTMPFPDRDIIYSRDFVRRNNPAKTFISGRGCPYRCTYCFNHRYNALFRKSGPVIRKKSVDYVLEEVRRVKVAFPMKLALFNDDTFIVDKKWFFEFSKRFLRETGLLYACNVRANLVDEDIVRALAESGCAAVNWSIESGNEFFRNEVLKRGMTRENILKAAELFNKYKIPHRIGNVIGLPGESLEQMFETLEINIAAKPTLALANIFVPFPGLELTQYALDRGHFTEIAEDKLPLNYFSKSVMNIPPEANDTIQRLMCLFPVFAAMPWLYASRRARGVAFTLPKWLLRIIYEIIYVAMFRSMYRIKGGVAYTSVTGYRYLRNIIRSIINR
jgi:radical SAM superfamily enzyme YgiQ (UPF0313 family)